MNQKNDGASSPASPTEQILRWVIGAIFIAWGSMFIYQSSFIAIDGKRYFCLFDDAMISMRYAWNLAHGNGLVWNAGEYVQGYTNLFMTLWMSLSTLFFDKSTAVLLVQISGIGFMLGIAYVSMRIADHFAEEITSPHHATIRLLAFLCPLLYYPLAYWSLMGMETGLLTLLVLAGILAALNYAKHHRTRQLWQVAVSFGLAYLTRNDSLIFATLVWLYLAHAMLISGRDRTHWIKLVFAMTVYGVFVIGQSLFQYLYYGELLPNTYTLKLTGMALSERVTNGANFVTPFLSSTALIIAAAGVYLLLRFSRKKLLLLCIVLAAISYQIYVGGDPWKYWRIMSPAMPLALILFICSVVTLLGALCRLPAMRAYLVAHPTLPTQAVTTILTVMLVASGLWLANAAFLPEMSLQVKPYQAEDNRANVNTALVLKQLTSQEASIGVFWAGTIPYFSGRHAFDFLGKSDRYIAHLAPDTSGAISWDGMRSVPGHNKYDLNYSIGTLRPTYVQGFRWGTQDVSDIAMRQYIKFNIEGVILFLDKDSHAVLWRKLGRH